LQPLGSALKNCRQRTALWRNALGAPFSLERRTRFRWLREEPLWHAKRIPLKDVMKAFFFIEESGSFYAPIQKAGCTTITGLLGRLPSRRPGADGKAPPWRNPLHLGCGPEDLRSGARLAFTVVRNPVNRFWSAYNHLVVQNGDPNLGVAVRSSLALPPDRTVTPQLLLDYVERHPIGDLWFALRPQYAIFAPELLPVRVARLESLKADLTRLAEEGCLPKQLLNDVPWLNRRNGAAAREGHQGLDRRVQAVYARDMELLGYP
jgi:hypothetical protein